MSTASAVEKTAQAAQSRERPGLGVTSTSVGEHAAKVPCINLRAVEADVLCQRLGVCASSLHAMRFRVGSRAIYDPRSGSALTSFAAADRDASVRDAADIRLPESRRLAVDAGWTGIAHDLEILEGAAFTTAVTGRDLATGTRCDLLGATNGTPLGAPSPITAGGVAICVTVDFASDLTGTVNLATGHLREAALVDVGVFLGGDPEEPCPSYLPADGDPQLGKSGTCHGGPNGGGSCRIGGLAGHAYGVHRGTSGDCPPPGSPIAAFTHDVTATTGGVTFAPARPCVRADHGELCWCSVQVQQNACEDGTCTATPDGGVCAEGPTEQRCSRESFRACVDDGDCPAPGDRCGALVPRSCFTNPIALVGTPDPPQNDVAHPTLVDAFCMRASGSPAVNVSAGFPGPTTFVWPAEVAFER